MKTYSGLGAKREELCKSKPSPSTGTAVKEPTPRASRAIECAPKLSKTTLTVSTARAQHLAATGSTDDLTARFVERLELRITHARFAAYFLRTLDLRAACTAAGIGYETGRTYLKKLFQVTGTASQVELVVVLGWVGRGFAT